MHVDAAERAGIAWQIALQAMKYAGDHIIDRAGLGLIESTIDTIDIVAQIDLDCGVVGIEGQLNLDWNTARKHRLKRIMCSFVDYLRLR